MGIVTAANTVNYPLWPKHHTSTAPVFHPMATWLPVFLFLYSVPSKVDKGVPERLSCGFHNRSQFLVDRRRGNRCLKLRGILASIDRSKKIPCTLIACCCVKQPCGVSDDALKISWQGARTGILLICQQETERRSQKWRCPLSSAIWKPAVLKPF